MLSLIRHLRSERGISTLEWLVITAAVVALGAGVFAILQKPVDKAAGDLGKAIVTGANKPNAKGNSK